MENKQLSDEAIEYIKENYKRSWEDFRTSHQRFDYLLVTVDGAGVYLCLELMKFLHDEKLPITMSLKLSGISLAISIIFNFLSQFCAFNVYHNILKIEQIIAFDKPEGIKLCEKKIKVYHILNEIFMWKSVILMIIGFLGLINFLYVTF